MDVTNFIRELGEQSAFARLIAAMIATAPTMLLVWGAAALLRRIVSKGGGSHTHRHSD